MLSGITTSGLIATVWTSRMPAGRGLPPCAQEARAIQARKAATRRVTAPRANLMDIPRKVPETCRPPAQLRSQSQRGELAGIKAQLFSARPSVAAQFSGL